MAAPSITLNARELAVLPVVSAAPGLAGGNPNAVLGPIVDLGADRAGFLIAEAAGGGSSNPTIGHRLAITVRTRAETEQTFRDVAALTIHGNGNRNVAPLEVAKLGRYVQIAARPNVAGADFTNVRVTLEHA